MLLEIDADAAEEHAIEADVVLVGRRRRVEREERDLMAAREQLDRQGVVAEATSAIHPRSARSDRQDSHAASGSGNPAPSPQHPAPSTSTSTSTSTQHPAPSTQH